jgi:CheY-like chemotaxis protein
MLKMAPDTARIPIVVCTTNLRAIQDNQAWMASKGIRVVAKPFEIGELLEAVESMIGKANQPGLGPTAPAIPGMSSAPTGEEP